MTATTVIYYFFRPLLLLFCIFIAVLSFVLLTTGLGLVVDDPFCFSKIYAVVCSGCRICRIMKSDDGSAVSNPFSHLKISSHMPLENLQRSKCTKCHASRMYFCYSCHKYVGGIDPSTVPKLRLPLSVDILKHQKELDGKSTAVHAVLLAPDHVRIYTYPAIPDYSSDIESQNVLLLYPSKHAHPLSHYVQSSNVCTKNVNLESDHDEGERPLPCFNKIVMIDSTWNQVHSIMSDDRLQGLRCVVLNTQATNYWRRQHNCPDTYLATVEALHLFVKQHHQLFVGRYCGEYDDLLYFFTYFHRMVHENKTKNQLAKPKKSNDY